MSEHTALERREWLRGGWRKVYDRAKEQGNMTVRIASRDWKAAVRLFSARHSEYELTLNTVEEPPKRETLNLAESGGWLL